MKSRIGVASLISLLIAGACAQNSVSERDQRLNQARVAAEAKCRELKVVEGVYLGAMAQSNDVAQSISLNLEIKDIPTKIEEGVDPILVPILTGFMRIHFGESFQMSEYIGFSIENASYDPKREKLDIVIEHSEYKTLMLSLSRSGEIIQGEWTAPSMSLSGKMNLKGSPDGSGVPIMGSLKGSYQGDLVNTNPQSSLPEKAMISLVVVQNPTQIHVSGNIRFYLGPFGSSEYVEMAFTELQFNPLTRALVAKTSGEYKFTLRAKVENKRISGNLFSDALGEVAGIEVKKE